MPPKKIRDSEISKALRLLKKSDESMRELIKRADRFEVSIKKTETVFEALLSAIVFQQLHANAARTIYSRVKALFPADGFPDAKLILQTPQSTFRSAGLSAAKTAAVLDLARHQLEGLVPNLAKLRRMPNEEIIQTLTKVRGIGPWTVEMLLIFRLGRLNVMPSTDFGVRSGFALTYRKRKLPTPKKLLEFSARWHPYQTIAAWYFWKATDLSRIKTKV